MSRGMSPDEVEREARRLRRTALEDDLAFQILAAGLPLPMRELEFHPTRKWRFDFAWPEAMLAAEVDGGEWVRGRHWRPGGVGADRDKAIAADRLGWTVLHFTGGEVKDGTALAKLSAAMGAPPE